MKKEHYFYITAVVVVLIIALAAFIYTNSSFSAYKYTITRNNVDFVSNTAQPSDHLDYARRQNSYILSAEFRQSGPENSYMTSSTTLLNAVLVAKSKNVTLVARVLDSNGTLVECQSNFGDLRTNKTISVQDCKALLADNSKMKIFISLPDVSLKSPRIELDAGKITVTPSSLESVSYAAYVLSSSLFTDTDAIIARINDAAGQLK